MNLELRRRARRVGRALAGLSLTQWLVVAAVCAALVLCFSFGVLGDRREEKHTRRDTQHNANVAASLDAADANHNNAAAHEANRLEADGRYQESERAVDGARRRAGGAQEKDEEASGRYETTRRKRTSDLPAVTDDDVCRELRSINADADGCREE